MPISYRKMLELFERKGITSYTMRKEKIIGQGAWTRLQNGQGVDMRTIENICRYLGCQPGDLLEYIPETKEEAGE